MVNCASANESTLEEIRIFMFDLYFLRLVIIWLSRIDMPLTFLTVAATKLVVAGQLRLEGIAHRVLLVFEPNETTLSIDVPHNTSV